MKVNFLLKMRVMWEEVLSQRKSVAAIIVGLMELGLLVNFFWNVLQGNVRGEFIPRVLEL